MIMSTYLDAAEAARARKMKLRGISLWEIAGELGCTVLAVQWALIEDRS